MERIVEVLLERETIEREEFVALMQGAVPAPEPAPIHIDYAQRAHRRRGAAAPPPGAAPAHAAGARVTAAHRRIHHRDTRDAKGRTGWTGWERTIRAVSVLAFLSISFFVSFRVFVSQW